MIAAGKYLDVAVRDQRTASAAECEFVNAAGHPWIDIMFVGIATKLSR
jgi:hypothetical protein